MPKPRRLTDAEVSRKFEVGRDHPSFATARRISDSRPDRTVCDAPDIHCPHCGGEFQKDSDVGYSDFARGKSFDCGVCERTIWVEYVDVTVTLTLCTGDPDGE